MKNICQKISVVQFHDLPTQIPFDRQKITEIVVLNDGGETDIGFGYDSQGNLVGWANHDAYLLSLHDSVEFYSLIFAGSSLFRSDMETYQCAFLDWLSRIIRQIPAGKMAA